MVLGKDRGGCAFVEPAGVTEKWQLRLGSPLMSLRAAYQGYLGSTPTGVLKSGGAVVPHMDWPDSLGPGFRCRRHSSPDTGPKL